MRLKRQLREAGYSAEPETFRDLVIESFQIRFPAWTDETLLHNPAEACRFCDAIRLKAGVRLSDELILRTLSKARKRSEHRASA